MNLLLESKKELDKYEKNILTRENVEDLEDGSLDEINDRIIRSNGISYNRCPRFFKVCGTIVMFSRLIKHELKEQGIDRLLDKAEG